MRPSITARKSMSERWRAERHGVVLGDAEARLSDYQGTFHKFSEKYLDRYVAEFAGRHDIRPRDTLHAGHDAVRRHWHEREAAALPRPHCRQRPSQRGTAVCDITPR